MAKGEGQLPPEGDEGTEPAVVGAIAIGAICPDCNGEVDVVVEAWQVVGDGTFRCVDCRVKRIRAEAEAKVVALKAKADKAREDSRQQSLPLSE